MNRLYVVEEYHDGKWLPEIWSCRPTRAWARITRDRAAEGTDPKRPVKRRICIYKRANVAR